MGRIRKRYQKVHSQKRLIDQDIARKGPPSSQELSKCHFSRSQTRGSKRQFLSSAGPIRGRGLKNPTFSELPGADVKN